MIWLLAIAALASPDLADLDAAVPDAQALVQACRAGANCDRADRALYTLILHDWVYGDPVDPREIGSLETLNADLFAKLPSDVRSQRGQAFRFQAPKRENERPDPVAKQLPAPIGGESERPDPVLGAVEEAEPTPIERAIALQSRGEISSARVLYEGIRRGERGFYEAQFRLGLIFRQIDDLEAAIVAFGIAAAADHQRTTGAMLQLGQIYEDLDDPATARSWYDLAGLSDSTDGQRAVLRSAWLAHVSGDDREASRLFDSLSETRALAEYPLMTHRLRILSELPTP